MRKLLLIASSALVPSLAAAELKVLASFSILGDFASQVGGDLITVETIVGVGQDTHVYSPSLGDAQAAAEADLIIFNGMGFEEFVADLVSASGSTAHILTVTDTLALTLEGEEDHDAHEEEGHDEHGHDDHGHEDHEDEHHDEHMEDGHDDHGHEDHEDEHHDEHMEDGHDDHDHDDHDEHAHENHDDHDKHDDHDDHGAEEHSHAGHDHGGLDPHAWNAVANAISYVHAIEHELAELDPANAATYEANAEAYIAELQALQDVYAARIEALPADHRTVVTSHDAFAYLEAETGLTFLAPRGFASNSAVSVETVFELIEQLNGLPHAAVFVQGVDNPAVVAQIAEETGYTLGGRLYSDTLTDADGPAPSYIAMYRYNMEQILSALEAN